MRRLATAVLAASVLIGCSGAADTPGDERAEAIEDGAVALCNDGGFSDNHDLTATCSGGDGIDEWLAEYGRCEDDRIVALAEDACGSSNDLAELMPADYEPPSLDEQRAEAIEDGAVALCNDGGFSDNHDLTATCSGGDGIDEWLAEYGRCEDDRIVALAEDACGSSNDLAELMPADYEPPPPTTAPPTTTAPPITTTTTAPPPPTTAAPPTTAPPTPAPVPFVPPRSPSNTSFANCTEAREAGAAPLHQGDPGYSSDLDRDGDGIACE